MDLMETRHKDHDPINGWSPKLKTRRTHPLPRNSLSNTIQEACSLSRKIGTAQNHGKRRTALSPRTKTERHQNFILSQHMLETLVSNVNCVWPASVNDFVRTSPKH